jgi:predicted Zn-dependent protease
MRRFIVSGAVLLGVVFASPAGAQLGGLTQGIERAQQARKTVQDLTFSDADEFQLGSDISAKLRDKYGVVQDASVHKYVSLVGMTLAQASTRPNLKWTFVVLDTDGVNAFAAPGGFVHITRGALAIIQNESELATVLGHELAHVTEKHTVKAIQKSKGLETAAASSRSAFLQEVAQRGYEMVLENSFDRGDETAADRVGVTLANRAGYAPGGLAQFLNRLADRNKNLKERSGMFASHPETQARLDALTKAITAGRLTATALVGARYGETITYRPVAVTAVAQVAPPSAASAAPDAKGGGKLGLGGLSALGRERSSSQTVSSAGSRGVNPDRDAKGGPNKALVAVTVTAAEVAAFKTGITG